MAIPRRAVLQRMAISECAESVVVSCVLWSILSNEVVMTLPLGRLVMCVGIIF